MAELITIPRATVRQVLEWANNHGEIVFSGGGMEAVGGMNAWTQALRAALEQPEQGTEQQHPARQRFDDTGGREEPDPVERLRFFCSLAMNKQDWLDVEAFFDDVLAERQKNAALEQPERPNLLGWSFHRNSDGSIGIKSPPPRPGESKRTSESVYPNDGGGLHELLSKFVDHINALEQPELRELLISAAAMAVAAERKLGGRCGAGAAREAAGRAGGVDAKRWIEGDACRRKNRMG